MTSDPRKKNAKSILLHEDDEEDDMEVDEVVAVAATPEAGLLSASSLSDPANSTADALLSQIITPSPYAQHNAGPTSARFRNALNRVTSHPTTDIEAWQALMTEVNSCYRTIASIHAVDADTHAKLDWVESCYGCLLKHFPYASTYLASMLDMLLAQSARVGEPDGPYADYGMEPSRRSILCERKAQLLFQQTLGVPLDGETPSAMKDGHEDDDDDDDADNKTLQLGQGMCSWVVEIWRLYIRKAGRDALRRSYKLPPDERAPYIRDATTKAYDLALSQAGFVHHDNHLLWKDYVAFVRSWIPDPANNTNHALAQQQMIKLRAVYQQLITYPMSGLDQLWQEYEVFERGQSEALAQALLAEFAPKYQHARTVYLERNRVYNVSDLQLGRLATPPVQEDEEDYAAKMDEEHAYLTLWKTRCSYERTNPGRHSSSDLAVRIRSTFKEMACVLTRHPECWHAWSMWELLAAAPSDRHRKAARAMAVLQNGQEHIGDCTLLVHAESQMVELHTETPSDCLGVMDRFLERSPNTLAFVLYQRMVRRYRGMEEARAVFSRARRTLLDEKASAKQKEDAAKTDQATEQDKDATGTDPAAAADAKKEANGSRWIVTNRLKPEVGTQASTASGSGDATTGGGKLKLETEQQLALNAIKPGVVTWHLYASHAMIEHRLNRSPEIAARVYELGLRKHASFLTKPPYVTRYAQLLLELGDNINLRALLTRAVAACEAQEKQDALGMLWDATLYFESVIGGSDPSSVSSLQAIERKRREALMGPDVEDIATGGMVGVGDSVLIGAQKATIAEQLNRAEGYDTGSNIANGLSRTVDLLGIMGLWGSDDHTGARAKRRNQGADKDGEISGSSSDESYQRRLLFHNLKASGMNAEAATMEGGLSTGSKLLSARERLQGAAAATSGPGQGTAMMMAIQASPEWLRPLLLLLPASRLRLPIVAKPPPHLTEMVLSMLQYNSLPAERPTDVGRGSIKRSLADNGGNSSDEDVGATSGGYGNQFRARQRARMASSQSNGTAD